LVGGTAIALQLGHRRSIDFDLFTQKRVNSIEISKTIYRAFPKETKTGYQDSEQTHYIIKSVKLTFFHFDFPIPSPLHFESSIRMPDLLSLAAMKAFALGGRGKWKDYVDLFFILKDHFSIMQIAAKANDLFGDFFNERLLREQLSYFKNLDDSEPVEFLIPSPSETEIKSFLTEVATQPF